MSWTSLRKKLFDIPDYFFDPDYDFDFTYMTECDSVCTRWGEPYKRPYGWMRFALDVWNVYRDGNAWLGKEDGWRNHSESGEWPVSYHGTTRRGAEKIIKSYYKAGDRQKYGRGIYSTPDVNEAEEYAEEFKSQRNGRYYKVVIQNRVNPKKRVIFEGDDYWDDYWLIPIPDWTSAADEKKIVESSIRPYGLLLKEV